MAPQPLTFHSGDISHRVWHWPSIDPRGGVLVALHGFSGSGQDFEIVAENRNENYAWYAPDFIGHGQTEAPSAIKQYSICAMINNFAWMLEHFKIIQPVVLGYSMGGRVALQYALAKPETVRALVLVGVTAGISDKREIESRRRADDELADEIINRGIEVFADKWECNPLIATQDQIPEPYRKAMKERRRLNQPIGLANSLRAFGTGEMNPVWDKLGTINCPILLVTGDVDLKFTRLAEEMQNAMSSVKHVLIPQSGHAAHLEAPHIFSEELRSFLNGL